MRNVEHVVANILGKESHIWYVNHPEKKDPRMHYAPHMCADEGPLEKNGEFYWSVVSLETGQRSIFKQDSREVLELINYNKFNWDLVRQVSCRVHMKGLPEAPREGELANIYVNAHRTFQSSKLFSVQTKVGKRMKVSMRTPWFVVYHPSIHVNLKSLARARKQKKKNVHSTLRGRWTWNVGTGDLVNLLYRWTDDLQEIVFKPYRRRFFEFKWNGLYLDHSENETKRVWQGGNNEVIIGCRGRIFLCTMKEDLPIPGVFLRL